MYTIEYEHDGAVSILPMWFAEKQLAIASACELLKVGFRVSKVDGPGFHMGRQSLDAYRRALLARAKNGAFGVGAEA